MKEDFIIENGILKECNPMIKSITIPSDVTEISFSAFDNCKILENIIVSKGNLFFCDIDGILFNHSCTMILKYPPNKLDTKYTIPNGVAIIGYYAFSDCHNLIEVNLPNGVLSIEHGNFDICNSLEKINLPYSLKYIGDYCFYDCKNLEIKVPKTIQSIGAWSFDRCKKITYL